MGLTDVNKWIYPYPSTLREFAEQYGDGRVTNCIFNCGLDALTEFNIEGYFDSPANNPGYADIVRKEFPDKCCTDKKETKNDDIPKGENSMEMFNGMFGKVANGMCRLSMNGGIAVKTSNGYKTYNVKSGRLVNCSNFVFNIGEEFFFVIPTNKVEPGDIILIAGKPKCVIKSDGNTITVINYEDSVVETILPERHVFMGNTYFYGKIMSMFGDDILKDGKGKGTQKLMKYMLMSEMMKGMNGKGDMSSMMPLLMMNGGMGDIFGDIFNFEDDEEPDVDNETKPE